MFKIPMMKPGRPPEIVEKPSLGIEDIRSILNCQTITSYRPPSLSKAGMVAYVDDEGLLNGSHVNFLCLEFRQPICGSIMVSGIDNEGEERQLTENEIKLAMNWLRSKAGIQTT